MVDFGDGVFVLSGADVAEFLVGCVVLVLVVEEFEEECFVDGLFRVVLYGVVYFLV